MCEVGSKLRRETVWSERMWRTLGQGGPSSNESKELVFGFWVMLTSQNELGSIHLVAWFGRVGQAWLLIP